MTDATRTKADRLAAAGAVHIARHDEHSTDAVVASATDPDEAYAVGWNRADGWWCACPAHRTCCHVLAVRQVLTACAHDRRCAAGVAWCRRCGADLPAPSRGRGAR